MKFCIELFTQKLSSKRVFREYRRSSTRCVTRTDYENNKQDAPYRLIYYSSQLYMFQAIFWPIIRSTWPYLQYLVVFTQVAAGWCLGWVETELCALWGALHTSHKPHSSVSTHPRHQPAATWMNTTRYCKYGQVLLMMGQSIARNM
jgi:hypothetical protein